MKELSFNLLVKHNKIVRETFKGNNDLKQPLCVLNKQSENICQIAEHEGHFMPERMPSSTDVKFGDDSAEKSLDKKIKLFSTSVFNLLKYVTLT